MIKFWFSPNIELYPLQEWYEERPDTELSLFAKMEYVNDPPNNLYIYVSD